MRPPKRGGRQERRRAGSAAHSGSGPAYSPAGAPAGAPPPREVMPQTAAAHGCHTRPAHLLLHRGPLGGRRLQQLWQRRLPQLRPRALDHQRQKQGGLGADGPAGRACGEGYVWCVGGLGPTGGAPFTPELSCTAAVPELLLQARQQHGGWRPLMQLRFPALHVQPAQPLQHAAEASAASAGGAAGRLACGSPCCRRV